jgi:Abortive infection alpha
MALLNDQEAKAVQEVAKLGQKTVDTVTAAGRYLTKVFEEPIRFIAMTLNDSAAGMFIRNRASVIKKTEAHLARLGVKKDSFQRIEERNIIPLLEAISIESDETVQDIWATYIANAMDPKKENLNINRQLIDLIKKLEPKDLPILTRLNREDLAQPRNRPIRLKVDDFLMAEGDLNESLARLTALGLFIYETGGVTGFAPPKEWEVPCNLKIITSLGEFTAQPLLMTLQTSLMISK